MSTLIYVVGPSGAGKDTLLGYARTALAGEPVFFAHRYITRRAAAGGENHVALGAAEFEAREARGLFALTWRSHGHAYGLGAELHGWLAAGAAVVVNGSRERLPEARAAFPGMATLEVTVRRELLRERLLARGRETATEVEARVERAERHAVAPGPRVRMVDNSGAVAEGGEAMVRIIREIAGLAACGAGGASDDWVTPAPSFHGAELARAQSGSGE